GEAVAIGMMLAAHVSRALGWLDASACKRIESLLERAGLPTTAPGIEPEAVLEHMAHDKKADRHGIKLVLLESIGKACVSPAPERAFLLDTVTRSIET